MRKSPARIISISLLVFALFYFFLWKTEKVEAREIETTNIEDFDLILTKGQSVYGRLISLLNIGSEDYTHIGIIVKDKDKVEVEVKVEVEDKVEVFVLHATPDGSGDNGIRYDDLQTFLELSDVCDYTLLRYTDIPEELRQKLHTEFQLARTTVAPFDFDFDNEDDQKIYCSELVWRVFHHSGLIEAGLDLSKPIYPREFIGLGSFIEVRK